MARFSCVLTAMLLSRLSFAQTVPGESKAPEFDVATVKPSSPEAHGTRISQNGFDNLKITNATLKALIASAYEVREFQITGGSTWIGSDRFDVEAKVERTAPPPDFGKLTSERRLEMQGQFNRRLQSLLAERFQLVFRRESKEMAVYALVQAKGGTKLKPSEDRGDHGTHTSNGKMTVTQSTMGRFAIVLASLVGRLVIDKTDLPGTFDWTLEWTPESGSINPNLTGSAATPVSAPDVSGPSIFTALQEQLGLKLESQKAPGLLLVVERAEKPSAN